METIRKREGFEGQRAIVLPKKILEHCNRTQPISSLYITDIGFYPRAKYHYRERPEGILQNILIYCTEGKGWLQVPNGSYRISPNEFLIIPAGMPHKYGADDAAPWTIHWIHFKGNQAPHFISQLSKQDAALVNYAPLLKERFRIFDSIYNALETGYSIDNLIFSNISLAYFLVSLNFAEKFISDTPPIEKDKIEISIEFMQNHLHEHLALESIASSVNLSISHYSSVFRKKTGYPPMIYFNHLKIQHACQYLQFTTLRINEIANKLGIEDSYYFSRLFTKIMGLPPLEYRKRKYQNSDGASF